MSSATMARTGTWRPEWRGLLALAALVVLWLFFLRNSLNDSSSFALYLDNEFLLGPVLSAMSESMRAGEWPLRFDGPLGGLPLYDLTQLSAWYPLYLLPLPLYETPQDAIHGIHLVVVLHLLIMEITSYIFLRTLGAGRLAAVTGAALIAFGANSLAYAYWVNITAPYAWFPLFLAGLLGLAQGGSRRKYAVMTWVGIVMLTLASPAQPLIHSLMMAGVFALFFWFSVPERGFARVREQVIPLAVLAGACLLVVAPVLLPAVVNLPRTMRWIGPLGSVTGNERIPLAAFELEQLARAGLGGVLFKFSGPAVGQQFIGLVTAALALITVFSRRRNWMVNALIFVALYSLVSAFGTNFGLGHVNYWLPLVNKIREPTRFLFLFQFATCALAALAIDELRTMAGEGGRLLMRQWLALGLLVGAALLVRLFLGEQIIAAIRPLVLLAGFVVLLVLTGLAPRLPFAGKGLALAGLWSVAALLLLAREVNWSAPPITASHYQANGMAELDAALARINQLDPNHDYRVVFDGSIDKYTASMLASTRGIRSLNMYFNPFPRVQFEELFYNGARGDNYARVLGAKYLVCKDCTPDATRDYSFFESVAGYELYVNAEALPHSYIATRISGDFTNIGDFAARAAPLPLDANFLFVQTWDRMALQELDSASAGGASCTSREDFRGTNTVLLGVECDRAAMVVLNKFHDGNWHASVDGRSAWVYKVNGNQLGVKVPAGTHAVEFRYLPNEFMAGLVLGIVGLLASLWLLIGHKLRRSLWPMQTVS